MAFDFKFPDVGEGIHEGKIVKWLVKEGDEVKTDDPLAEVETDKAVVEIPTPRPGKILKLYHKEGETMKVGETMATIQESGLPAGVTPQNGASPGNAPAVEHEESTNVVGSLEPTAAGVMKAPTSGGGAVFGGPVTGGGQALGGNPFTAGGAVFGGNKPAGGTQTPAPQSSQAQNAQPASGNQPASAQQGSPQGGSMAGVIKSGIKAVKKYDLFGYVDHVPYDGVRKAVGDHIAKSLYTAPHVTHMDTADVTDLWAKREEDKAQAAKDGIKLTFLAYIVKATCEALKKHPYVNAMLDEENHDIILRKYYNIGIAVDTEAGLMVPVLKAADRKTLFSVAREIGMLAESARSRKINPMDFKGGSFTITNVGSAGSGKYFTPVINFPESAILGVGLIEDTPVVRNGKIEVRKVVYLSLSFDHRILDGAEAARFVKDLKDLLEGTVPMDDSAGLNPVKGLDKGGDKPTKSVPAKSGTPKKTPKKRLVAKKKN